ncbi:hypothetical protein G3570_09330 [Balneolaceae bacterium YR4-1]|uniref:Uncharacterized protein n=1 Tax=Halalkalibaculum roseum TaxID=2709311 RepID=A0A6M1T9E3_9BACT|nr:hypothetical protein [Halalkalibaculum roseum]NGP76833.1 hypothetical protein [Halalkalibaculum roseum]
MALEHQEITDGNRLISQFMGSTIKINQDDVKDIPLAFLKLEDMKFHVAWKWLMPVVIKIEDDLGYSITIKNKTCRVTVDEDTAFESEEQTKMEAVWKAVVQFLEWNKENS